MRVVRHGGGTPKRIMMIYAAIISILGGFTPLLAATPGPILPTEIVVDYSLADNGTALVGSTAAVSGMKPKAVNYRQVTAYTSAPEETDDTPFITAAGTRVRPGIAAANWLPFGATIRIPELFGERVFVVEDRMHKRNSDKVDIWFSDKSDALKFGTRRAKIEIL